MDFDQKVRTQNVREFAADILMQALDIEVDLTDANRDSILEGILEIIDRQLWVHSTGDHALRHWLRCVEYDVKHHLVEYGFEAWDE